MQQMQIYGVSFDMVGKQPIVLLKTVDGNRFLPIWIGHPEAAAILMKLQGAQTPRPMTHDLLNDMLEQLDAKCERVSVTELRDNTFYASITISVNGSEIEIDSRPSDAIALAVRSSAPIFAAEGEVLDAALRTWDVLGFDGFGRVDMILADDGPQVLEANAIPGLTDTSLLPMAAEAAGLGFERLVDRLLELALAREPTAAV